MIVGMILAAGKSERMGTPKQLLPWGDSTVLQRVVDVASASRLDMVIVILGHRADEIEARINASRRTRILVNRRFEEGMGSSLKWGIRNAPPEAEAFMLILGDQPFIDAHVIDALIDSHRARSHGITVPVCNGRRGHPVIFDARYRAELLSIGDRGAREVVMRHAGEIVEVPVESSLILRDMDTPEEYRAARMETGE